MDWPTVSVSADISAPVHGHQYPPADGDLDHAVERGGVRSAAGVRLGSGGPGCATATWRFDVSGGDTTRLRYTACIGPGRSAVSVLVEREPQRREQIVAYRLAAFRQGMASTLAGNKELVESAGQPG